ncbi:thiamine-phosphate kinase|uniref:Thiamine-monophosphate kinase n=1 Tax=Dendrosporobacter quercicolus TaxID=146817 RepID=A0A1G9Y9G4_9FIRM|nr:thiamine-phosphate kinase [Dendrosporobacter quercicolus]NSL47565.1 thiamine-phosphate kinase [Dendrosporobacter quercicolus DSM 1736]SDN05185.1 thiamine-phosphate kinase [Dendrosporobacter quercicolus]
MELKQLGEFGLIDLIKENTIVDPASVIVGIGDDAAALLPSPRQLQLLATDMLIESVHFDLTTTTPWQLGYKAIAVNLSDIAAMGGVPKHCVVSLALPRNVQVDFVRDLYQGMKEICRRFTVNIVGGDTVSSPQGLVLNVAVTGEVEPARLQRRSGAKPGDLVVVTGELGNSAAGLDLLRRGHWQEFVFARQLVTCHLTPQPQVQAGLLLAAFANSMNDISDGLASEANEIAAASQVAVRLFEQQIPLSAELTAASAVLGNAALDYALYGGEDYQLLFTIEPEKLRVLPANEITAQLTVIGEIVRGPAGVELVAADGAARGLAPKGYNHFG